MTNLIESLKALTLKFSEDFKQTLKSSEEQASVMTHFRSEMYTITNSLSTMISKLEDCEKCQTQIDYIIENAIDHRDELADNYPIDANVKVVGVRRILPTNLRYLHLMKLVDHIYTSDQESEIQELLKTKPSEIWCVKDGRLVMWRHSVGEFSNVIDFNHINSLYYIVKRYNHQRFNQSLELYLHPDIVGNINKYLKPRVYWYARYEKPR